MKQRSGYAGCMPFNYNAARRHRMPRARYRVTNWPAYEAGLQRRGDLTFWLDKAALAEWHAPRWRTPGGQPPPVTLPAAGQVPSWTRSRCWRRTVLNPASSSWSGGCDVSPAGTGVASIRVEWI
jgi:hypothetical protein